MQTAVYTLENNTTAAVIIGLVLLIIALSIAPLSPGLIDDWSIFRSAALITITPDQSLYSLPDAAQDAAISAQGSFHNPPWVAVMLIPLAILPLQVGWAVLLSISILIAALLLLRWLDRADPIRLALVILSPPMIYLMLHGQIDLLMLGVILLPQRWWLIGSTLKPQVTLTLLFGIPLRQWPVALALSVVLFGLSLLLFGLWPLELISLPTEHMTAVGRNLWFGLWPFQVPLGFAFLLAGIQNHNERLLVVAAPFLVPYAAMSSFIGVWLVAVTMLTRRDAALVLLAWWGAFLYRMFV